MANKLANRVKVTVSGTPGTGTITLGSAVSGFMDFATAGVSNGNTVPYVIEDSNAWEIGVGTYTSSGTTLARTSITASSNGGATIIASSNAIVMISPLAADLQAGTSAGNLIELDGTGKIPALDGSLLTGLNASNISSGTIASARVPTLNQNTTGTAAGLSSTLAVGSGGTGTGTAFTAGSVVFAGTSGVYSQNNSQLFWDNTNSRLGVGTASPSYKIDVNGTARIISDVTINTGRTISGGTGGAILSSSGINNDIVMNGRSAGITGGWAGLRIHQVANLDGLALIGDTSQTAAYMRIENSSGGTVFYVNSSGNLGLGVTPSAYRLDIQSSTTDTFCNIQSTGNNYSAVARFVGKNGAADSEWNIIAAGGFLAGSVLRFTKGNWTGTPAMTLDASENLLVGTTSTSLTGSSSIVANKQFVVGLTYNNSTATDFVMTLNLNASINGMAVNNAATSGTNTAVRFQQNATVVGSITTTNTATAFNPSSDARLKTNILPMTDGLARVSKLKPVTFDWIADGTHDDGFIAQDLMTETEFAIRVNPIGKNNGEEYYGVDYMRFVSVLTAAIQELAAKVAALEAKK